MLKFIYMCVCIRRTELDSSKMSWQTVATIALPLLIQNTKIKNRFIQNYDFYFAIVFICRNNEKKKIFYTYFSEKVKKTSFFRIKKEG